MSASEDGAAPQPPSSLPEPLAWTGERYLPGITGAIAEEHLHRYALAAHLTVGMRVLDIACGEGYGSALLAQGAASVVGVDVAADAVEHARRKYAANHLEFREGKAEAIPATDGEFDAVVSFETIEHLTDHAAFVAEVRRVLKPGGLLIMSSPDKHFYSEITGRQNSFHLRELHGEEFRGLLKGAFRNVATFEQRVAKGSLMLMVDSPPKVTAGVFRSDGQSSQFFEGVPEAVFLVALASDAELPAIPNSLFEWADPSTHPFPNPYFAEAGGPAANSPETPKANEPWRAALEEIDTLERKQLELRLAAGQPYARAWERTARLHKALRSETKRLAKEAVPSVSPLPAKLQKILKLDENVLQQAVEIAASGLFDMAWYLQRYPDVMAHGMDPLEHFLGYGVADRRDPAPLFHTAFYLKQCPDAAAGGLNPLLHFIRTGWREGCRPHPQFWPDWYLQQNPDVIAAGINPLLHFMRYGCHEGRLPCPNFLPDTTEPTRESIVRVLLRFATDGAIKERRPSPSPGNVPLTQGPPLTEKAEAGFTCRCCGGAEFSQQPVLWKELVEQWKLSPEEAAGIDRQQGLHCVACGATLRSITLAHAIMKCFGFEGVFRDFVESPAAAKLRILEINEAGQLHLLLRQLPHHTLASYPDCDMTRLPFEAGQFDLVTHSDTLEHVPDPVLGLAECHRVLRPGGFCIFTVPLLVNRLTRSRRGLPASYHGSEERSADYFVHTEYGADAWGQLMEAGFQECRVITLDHPFSHALAGVRGALL